MKHAYFVATEALAGLLCNARLDHTYRPLAIRALDQSRQIRDAGCSATGDLFDQEVEAVERDKGRPLDVVNIPLNPIGCRNDISGHKSGGHSVGLEKFNDDEHDSTDQEHCERGNEREQEEQGVVHGLGSCRCGGTLRQGGIKLASGVNTGVFCLTAANLPKRGERDAAVAGQRKHLRMTKQHESGFQGGRCRYVYLHDAHTIPDPVRNATVSDILFLLPYSE